MMIVELLVALVIQGDKGDALYQQADKRHSLLRGLARLFVIITPPRSHGIVQPSDTSR